MGGSDISLGLLLVYHEREVAVDEGAGQRVVQFGCFCEGTLHEMAVDPQGHARISMACNPREREDVSLLRN